MHGIPLNPVIIISFTSLFDGSNALSISARTSIIPRAFWISVKLAKQVLTVWNKVKNHIPIIKSEPEMQLIKIICKKISRNLPVTHLLLELKIIKFSLLFTQIYFNYTPLACIPLQFHSLKKISKHWTHILIVAPDNQTFWKSIHFLSSYTHKNHAEGNKENLRFGSKFQLERQSNKFQWWIQK